MGVAEFDGRAVREHRINFLVQPPKGGKFVYLTGIDFLNPAFEPQGFDETGEWLLALETQGGRKALVRYAADGSHRRETLFADQRVDIDGVLRIGKYDRPVAAAYTLDAPEYHYFDPAVARLSAALTRALGKGVSVSVIGESWDGQRKLAVVEGAQTPARWFLYDVPAHKVSELLLARPDLAGIALAATVPVSYPAEDGTLIPAYLTLPLGRTAGRPGAAIVMPHGGPAERDALGYDWLAQYFAAMGYAVLQPNFRGSTGYGDKWFAKNGFQSWRTAIGDINSGGRWLIAQGTADPARLAIVGWSYGGYAALQANVIDPALYKATIAVAPVTDLQLMRDEARAFGDEQLFRDYIGSGPELLRGSPARNAARIAAPVLIFQGDHDVNVDAAQAHAMDAALAKAGRPHELIVYPGLDHQLSDGEVRARMLRRAAEFLSANLGGVSPSASSSAPR